MMRKRLVSTICSCLLLVLVLVNILLGFGNQSLQSEVSERQQMIAQAIHLETLHRQAVKPNDPKLKELLAASGFTLSPKPEAGKVSK